MNTFFRCSCFIGLVALLLPCRASGQVIPDADSLLQRLPHLQGAAKVGALLDLCVANLGKDKEKTVGFARQALETAERLKNDSLTVRSLNYLGIAYLNHGESQAAIQTARRAVDLARRAGNNRQLLDAMSNLASAYIRSYRNDKALETAQEGLTLAEQVQDLKSMVNFMEVIAEIQKDLKQWEAAERTYKREMGLVERLGRPFEKARAYNNMGLLYVLWSKNAEAAGLFEKAREQFRILGYPSGEAVALLNLADALLSAGNYTGARAAYSDVLERNRAIQDPEMQALATAGLGAAILSAGNPEGAAPHLRAAEKVAQENGIIEALREVYHYMENLSVAKGDYPAAWAYKRKSEVFADSVTGQKTTERVQELQVQYDTQKKEAEIARQRTQLLEQQGALFRQRTWIAGLLAGAVALAALGWLFHNRYRLRQKALLDAAVIREQQLGLNAVLEAQEAERRRIAKDLHDGIAQELVALKLGFNALQNKIGATAPAEAGRLGELAGQLDASCTELRNIAHVMLPPALERHGLGPGLELLLRRTAEQAGFRAEFDQGDLPARLPEKMETGLYRIAQELLNNIAKHAQASHIVLQLYTAGNNLILRLEDDGVGFDFEAAKKKGSMGLLNILSRAGALGGVFYTEPRTPKGTLATIRVPLIV
ncbi:MAG: hypothetical protein IPM81_19735 [Saprospirales bacterium]|nr:hypothetical protein [Saprospirales bacterium]